MISQREYIEKHQKYLDEEFVKKYPDGMFTIQQRGKCVNIYVNFKRRDSCHSCLYPSAFGIEEANLNSFGFINNQNNSFGKVTYYKSLDRFLIACKKYLVKRKAIEMFLLYYNDKDNFEFVEKADKHIYRH